MGIDAPLAAVNNGDIAAIAIPGDVDGIVNGLAQEDVNYFRKQAVKYMITHNMLKYHYPEITL